MMWAATVSVASGYSSKVELRVLEGVGVLASSHVRLYSIAQDNLGRCLSVHLMGPSRCLHLSYTFRLYMLDIDSCCLA